MRENWQLITPAWMFANCFPNTLDTTVHFGKDEDGNWRTFVYTGDIHAMWLRDSGAQVWPYVRFAKEDEHLRNLLAGVINCQFSLICHDPYANAYNDGPTGSEWESDFTEMNPYIHERKWEIDSQCYPIRLAYEYWKVTGDDSVFGPKWVEAAGKILETLRAQQRKDGLGPYSFRRTTDRQLDTKCCDGYGNPVNPVGLIVSSFRPSDDATTFDLLGPSNILAVSALRKAAEGIGGPHIGYDMVWPMSIIMRALTSDNDKEIKWCVETLLNTDAGTGFMHESFHKDDPSKFTRKWFAWANTLFGEMILHLIDEGKIDLLNSVKTK